MESTTIADMTSAPEDKTEVQMWYVNWSSGDYSADGSMRNILHGDKYPPSGYNTAFYNNAEFNKCLDDALIPMKLQNFTHRLSRLRGKSARGSSSVLIIH